MIHKASSTIVHTPSHLIISPCSGGTYSQRQRKSDSIVSSQHRSSSKFVFDFRHSAYEIYADPKSDKSFFPPSQTRAARGFRFSKAPHTSSESANPSHVYEQSAAARFKDTFSRDAKVHFVGVWCVVRFWAVHDCT